MASPYPTKAYIAHIFSHLAIGDPASFYAHVSHNVSWTVMGSNALSRHHDSKESFLSASVSSIGRAFAGPMKLRVTSIIGGETEDWAVVELAAEDADGNVMKCKNGLVYDQKYCWVTRWKEGKIVEVRAFLDGELLDRALRENGIRV